MKMYKCNKHNDSKMKENPSEIGYNRLYHNFGRRFLHVSNYRPKNLSILCIFSFLGYQAMVNLA